MKGGKMSFDNAAKQFNENFRLFGSDPKTQVEKYNFYLGLQNLAEGLKILQSEIYQINNRLQQIEQKFK